MATLASANKTRIASARQMSLRLGAYRTARRDVAVCRSHHAVRREGRVVWRRGRARAHHLVHRSVAALARMVDGKGLCAPAPRQPRGRAAGRAAPVIRFRARHPNRGDRGVSHACRARHRVVRLRRTAGDHDALVSAHLFVVLVSAARHGHRGGHQSAQDRLVAMVDHPCCGSSTCRSAARACVSSLDSTNCWSRPPVRD